MLQALTIQKHKHLYRELQLPQYKVDFFSNDYLGLARNHTFIKRCEQERSLLQPGSTGSRLLSGNSAYAEQFEAELAEGQGFETALLFPSGYIANLALLSALLQKEDVLLFDQEVHASMRDGIRLSKGTSYPYRHLDLNHLEERLRKIYCKGERYIATESLFSTDGRCTNLQDLTYLANKYGAKLILDEAHTFGVMDCHQTLPKAFFAVLITFSKALGSQGAAILCSKLLKEYLLNFSRPCLYSTFISPHQIAAMRTAYRMLPELETERQVIGSLKRSANAKSHILIFPQNSSEETSKKQASLLERGIAVAALRPPTVRKGKECLRISLHAFNTEEELKLLYG